MNAANEVAVAHFLKGKLSFTGSWEHACSVMRDHHVIEDPVIDQLIEADEWARNYAIA